MDVHELDALAPEAQRVPARVAAEVRGPACIGEIAQTEPPLDLVQPVQELAARTVLSGVSSYVADPVKLHVGAAEHPEEIAAYHGEHDSVTISKSLDANCQMHVARSTRAFSTTGSASPRDPASRFAAHWALREARRSSASTP